MRKRFLRKLINFPTGFFLILSGIYILTMSGHIYTIDSYHVFKVAESMTLKGSLEVPYTYMAVRGVDDKYYSKFGIGQSIAAIPFFKCAQLLYPYIPKQVIEQIKAAQSKVITRLDDRKAPPRYLYVYTQGPPDPFYSYIVLMFNPIVTALGMMLLLKLLMKLAYSIQVSFLMSCIAAFGTFVWPLSRDFFQHPLILVFLLQTIILWIGIKDQNTQILFFKMGIVGALAILTRVFTIIWIPIITAFLAYEFIASREWNKKRFISFIGYLAPILVSIVILAILNYVRFGDPMRSGYHTQFDEGFFSTPLLKGLALNFLSYDRSLFLFAPPILASIFGLKKFIKKNARLSTLIACFLLAYIILYSKWWSYQGGWCIGPRFLLPIVPLLLLPVAEIFRLRRGVKKGALFFLILLALTGIFLQVLWMSLEYTTMYQLNDKRIFSIPDIFRALFQSGRWGLDYWYINMIGEIPASWYIIFMIPPVIFMLSGLIIIRFSYSSESKNTKS